MKKIGVLGLMAALAVTGAVAFLPKGVMAAEDSDQTISQGVYIGDVDVSGMTQEEAKKAVEDDMSEAKAANITLKVDDQETVVSAKDLGLSWANEEVVQEAAELGKSGNIIKCLAWSTFLNKIDFNINECLYLFFYFCHQHVYLSFLSFVQACIRF